MLQLQTILQFFYKLLMCQIRTKFYLGSPLTLLFDLPIITHHISNL